MRLHRFQKISRTGRSKSAAAVGTAKQTKQRRKRALIEANDKTNQSEHQSRIEARLARRNHSSSNTSQLASGNNYKPNPLSQFVLVSANNFTQTTPDAIANDRAAEAP
jgi:hypothetical protein